MPIQNVPSRSSNGTAPTGTTDSNKDYKILHSRTASKSVQSKIKNLAYTLSIPFRALAKQIIQSRAHEHSGFNPITNIRSTVSSANQGKEMLVPSGEPAEIRDGASRQSLFVKIFG